MAFMQVERSLVLLSRNIQNLLKNEKKTRSNETNQMSCANPALLIEDLVTV